MGNYEVDAPMLAGSPLVEHPLEPSLVAEVARLRDRVQGQQKQLAQLTEMVNMLQEQMRPENIDRALAERLDARR